MRDNTRKSKAKGKTAGASWHFRFTPQAAALAGRIADGMTRHFQPTGEEGGPWTSAAVIDEAIAKGLACMAVEYLHETDALTPGSPNYLARVVIPPPPLPLPLASGPVVDAPPASVLGRLARLEGRVSTLERTQSGEGGTAARLAVLFDLVDRAEKRIETITERLDAAARIGVRQERAIRTLQKRKR